MAPKAGEFKSTVYIRTTALIKSRFTKLKAIVDELSNQSGTQPISQVQLKQLNTYTNELRKKKADFENTLQRAIVLEDDPISDETLSQDQDEIEALFSHINATIEVLLPPETPKTPSALSEASTSSQTFASQVRLPKLDLQKFAGDPLTWTSFINLFDTTIHRNATLSSVMKFQYLLSVLSGEPLNLIKSLNLTAANYLVAYNLLRDRYHNSRRLQSLHLNQLLDLPNITASHLKGLRQFVNLFTEHSQALKALDCDVSNETNNNPLLSALLLRKMDAELRKNLEVFRASSSDEPSTHSLPAVSEIMKFLNTECSQTEDANIHSVPHSSKNAYPPSRSHKVALSKKVHFRSDGDVAMVTALTSNNQSSHSPLDKNKSTYWQCFICNSNEHKIYSCKVFQNKTPQERHQLVKQQRRCVSCLGSHNLKDCRSQALCRTCNKKHHTLLHFPSSSNINANFGTTTQVDNNGQIPPQAKPNNSNEQPAQSKVSLTSQGHHSPTSKCSAVILGTLLVKLTSSKGTTHVFRALLDSGSMCDLITERAAQILGAKRHKSDIHLTGLSQNATYHKGQTYLDIETLSGVLISPQHPMLILDNLTVDLPRVPISPEVVKLTRRYVLADPSFHLPGRIDVVLGGSLFPQLLTYEQYSLGQHMPHVVGTHFGFVVMGSAPCASQSPTPLNAHSPANLNVALLTTSDANLHSALQRFWHQEEPPTYTKKSAEEELCDNHFQKTHSRDIDGRYIVRLPFKEVHPPLGSSQQSAERRFLSLERKFATQPQFSTLYHDFMNEYHSLGHMTKLETINSTTTHYYLPHHGVLKENSSSTKLRTVFDASSKTSTGVSLNDILLTGPKLQANICDILFHFRSYNVVFTCDIRQMYRQILVHPDDQKYQLILWRDKPSQDLSTYQLTTVTYGVNSSPYLAIKTLHQLAEDEGEAFPAAAQVVKSNAYVDDIITGADTIDDALELQGQLISLLSRGGFELRKWSSNAKELLQTLPQDHLETPVFLEASNEPLFSILGLHWSPVSDCFTYSLNFPPDPQPTKRSVLSLIAKIYDPCGFLSPFIMLAKCFMQYLWTTGLAWDEPLPTQSADKWHAYVADAQHLKKVSIPRALKMSLASAIELHGFSDASEAGYAAVVYIRCQLDNGDVIIRPIIAKTRVSPLKKVTLPRLELCAAHLLAQLVPHCLSLFQTKVTTQNIHLWCDSSVVLTWLRTPPYRLKTYVANRVAQTQELIPLESWRHIASADNPADCASRGISASLLVDHSLWWAGPPWLKLPRCDWPSPQFVPVDLSSSDETKTTPLAILTTAHHKEWNLLSTFSSWNKLQRIVALILRFLHNCRGSERIKGPLMSQEITKARLKIFSLVQQATFADEMSSLQNQRDCSTRLQRLKPFLDSDGILRVGGRLNRSSLPSDVRHPVLLPKKHHVVDLIVDHYHKTHLHSGPQLTQALLAQSVWILCARSVIRSRIFKCVTCFKNKPRNTTPLMGDLPPSRITPARPFLSTGIDYCGPFTIKVFNLRSVKHVKVYLCIFVCMVTKAVHVEVVTDLTTDGFLAALTRFVSRRGPCSDIYSDCGTNFVGADATLRRLIHSHVNSPPAQDSIQQFVVQKGINFHFNPPAAPHQGGLWESAVKSAKHHLRRVMGDTVLTLSQFITLSTQVEAMLNSRPLTPLSSDPADLEALTPGHFLIGAPLASVPEPNVSDVPSNRLKHWQLVQAFNQRIWQRWSLEYIHTLQQRFKWTQPRKNLQVGDLVLVHSPSSSLNWPLARVTAIHPGKDGIVRVVDLKTPSGHLTRPVVKVFPLPMN